MAELGLFPLPLVLVPTERIPLHIFEPRYLELIEECVATGGDFGFVLATGDGAVHEVGTRASVQRVLEALDDGTMNIVVEGGERFRLLELTKGRPFTTGIVEPVVDHDEPADDLDLIRARRALRTTRRRRRERRRPAGPRLAAVRVRARGARRLRRRSEAGAARVDLAAAHASSD